MSNFARHDGVGGAEPVGELRAERARRAGAARVRAGRGAEHRRRLAEGHAAGDVGDAASVVPRSVNVCTDGRMSAPRLSARLEAALAPEFLVDDELGAQRHLPLAEKLRGVARRHVEREEQAEADGILRRVEEARLGVEAEVADALAREGEAVVLVRIGVAEAAASASRTGCAPAATRRARPT